VAEQQIVALGLLVLALGLFAWGRWRFDIVALFVLIAGVALGVVSPAAAFVGFGHPAVITVAAVLIISRALAESGVMDVVAARLAPEGAPLLIQMAALCLMVAVLSMFMNNVGALAIIMPIAIASARKSGQSPAALLMPISFASMLGGMVTLVGTPPNVIIATYRRETAGEPFALLDFAPVGGGVAVIGIAFIVFIGWRLIPRRDTTGTEGLFGVKEYLTEVRIVEDGKAAAMSLYELGQELEKLDVDALNVMRGKVEVPLNSRWEKLNRDDALLLEGAPDAIAEAAKNLGLELAGMPEEVSERLTAGGNEILEVVVQPYSLIVDLTVEEIRLRSRYAVILLAVAREGHSYRGRLKEFRFAAGDVLLLQAPQNRLNDAIAALGLLVLAKRKISLGGRTKPFLTVGIVAIGFGLIAAGLAPAAIALAATAVALVILNVLDLRRAYEAIDLPVLVLLGAMLPVGAALESTGTTKLLADTFLIYGKFLSPTILLIVIMVLTMTLSDIINNAATAVMMAPIAVSLAHGLGVNSDAFLMAVAIGASCAFLTPIGHQNNTLIMGPGGYRFWDYWRLGLPLELLIVVVSVPLLLIFWPL